MINKLLTAALILCSLAAAAQSVDTEAWRAAGYQARTNGDYALAQEYYQKILDDNPEDYDARLSMGRILTSMANYRDAISVYREILSEDETDAEAMNGLGECYGLAGEDSLSVVYYEQALDFNPGEAEQYFLLAGAYANAGREEDAIEVYREVMKIDATYSEAWAGIGKMYYWLGLPASSIRHYRKALELDPENEAIRKELEAVEREMKWGLTLRTGPVQETEENYTINAVVTRLKLDKRLGDRFRLEGNFLLDYSNRDFTGDTGDTTRWYDATWLRADYLLTHHTFGIYGGYSSSDNKVSGYGLSWKLHYEPGDIILKNSLEAGYDYYYYWNRVGATSVTEMASVAYRFAELSGRYSYGLTDAVYTYDYPASDSGWVRENPYQTYAVSLNFKVVKKPDIRLGVSHSYLDYTYKSPLYYSPSGRRLTGASASIYYAVRGFYLYGSFSYNLGSEYNYEEGSGNGNGSGNPDTYHKVKMNVDNWSAAAELGYEHGPYSVSLGGSNFYNPYYQNLTGFIAFNILF